MAAIAIDELREHLRDYLSRVAKGETVLIADDGKVVARLVPAEEAVPDWLAAEPALLQLWREGKVTLPTSADRSPPPRLKGITVSLEQLLRDLDEDRADRC